MNKSPYVVTEKAKRPASDADRCFYCQEPIGGHHKDTCVLIVRTVTIRMIAEYDVRVPAAWSKDDVELHRNESSWCADNAITELETLSEDGCLCGKVSFEYLRDAGDTYLEEA